MHAKTREILDIIDSLLAEHVVTQSGQAATELWTVLTALRGPDNDNVAAKLATIQVRATAFPQTAERIISTSGAFSNCPMFHPADWMSDKEDAAAGGEHFEAHVIAAYRTLGLE